MNNTLKQMIERYNPKNINEETNAIKEILQEIILCGLSRSNFFNKAAFYGGTSLRIFYGLNRFSEDLDFALIEPNPNFDLTEHFTYIKNEILSYGLNLDINYKKKTQDSNISSAFLKGDTKEVILTFFPNEDFKNLNNMLKNIKIKFEIDINPPMGATYEFKYKLLPSPHQIRLYDAPSLFAGKIHAIICRGWKNRVKGRDLYDYVFYLSLNIKVNLTLIKNKLIESNYISKNTNLTINKLKEILNEKFKEIDYENAKEDVFPFISDNNSLDIWSSEFFIEITKNIEEN